MVFVKIQTQPKNLDARTKAVSDWNIPEEEKKDLLLFLFELSIGKVNRGTKISESRRLKYLDVLKPAMVYFNKPMQQLTPKDMEGLELDLTSNKIRRINRKPYSEETKSDIKRLVKIYLKWKLKNNPAQYAELTSWMDTRGVRNKTPEYLSEDEIIKLFKACKNIKERFLVAVLFDSGARIEEFLNIRFEDILQPANGNNYYRITLKEEYSKTMGRTIGLYWANSTEAVREYLEERRKEGVKSGDAIFDSSYNASRFFLSRLGNKILHKRVYPHLFRHSSATYYAQKLNRQELCYRYGWRFSSDMPDTYINRSGMVEKQVEEKFARTDIEELNKKLQIHEQNNKLLSEKIEVNEKQSMIIAEKITLLLAVLKDNREAVKIIIKKDGERLRQIFQ